MRKKTELAWERQPGESEEAYEAFTDYYKNPKRSQKKTAKAVGKSEAVERPMALERASPGV